MGPRLDPVRDRAPGLFLRLSGALLTIAVYVLVRDELDPAPRVAARFAVGVALFALFIDLGRAFAGSQAPLASGFEPHRQRADAMVDERYRHVHRNVRRFIDEGVCSDEYEALLREAMSGRGVDPREGDALLAKARRSAEAPPPAYRPLPIALAGGLVVVVGVAVAISVLLESFAIELAAPLLVLIGLGTASLMVRTIAIGERWATLVVGLAGALLLFLGASALQEAYGGRWSLLQLVSLGIAATALALASLHSFEKQPWPVVRDQLRDELSTLRRAFVATLLAGIVLFPFKPLLEALFEALGWSFDVPYRMAVIGYATVAAFLALELGGAWLALARGEQEAARMRRARIDANEEVLALLESRGPAGPRRETT